MSCFICGSKFGFMRKEHGCKNCGFSFCNKCLTKQTVVPKKNNEVHHVCDKCHDILTGKVKNEDKRRYSPPDAFKRRMAALDDKSSSGPSPGGSHGGVKQGSRPAGLNQQKYRGMSKADIEIAQRLERLKQDRRADAPPVPTTSEMEQRLAALKGQQPSSATAQQPGGQSGQRHNVFYVPPDTRTAQDRTNDLLDEARDEVVIESRHVTPQQDVESRLAHLRGNQPPPTSQTAMVPGDINRAKVAPSSVDVDLSGRGGDRAEIPLEELNALIRASARELEMDAERAVRDLQRDTELRERLERLKADRLTDEKPDAIRSSFAEVDDDDGDDDVATKRIIKQMLEEIKMDESLEASGIEPTSATPSSGGCYETTDEPVDPDELPWCCICNANATIRCTDCDYDLYCKRCFREGHKNTEYIDHQYREYRPRPNVK